MKDDEEKVKKMWEQMEVTMGGEEVEVKFRAGRKKEEPDAKPRPLIIKVKDSEKKERILQNARKLARKDDWRTVFVAPDMTMKQRMEDKKQEEDRKKEAEERTRKANEDGKKGKWFVVGRRGTRRIVWEEEVEPRRRKEEAIT